VEEGYVKEEHFVNGCFLNSPIREVEIEQAKDVRRHTAKTKRSSHFFEHKE